MITEFTCPNCCSSAMRVFYESRGVPLHCNILFDDRPSALNDPTADLVLAFCDTCAFISNVAFDPDSGGDQGGYEDRQTFSPRFCAFQSELIAELVARYALHNKDVLEIGCGQGDFLRALCTAGGNRGVGIDPLAVAGEETVAGRGYVRFLAERFSRRHADLACDFLCCRHTLEHVPTTSLFLRQIREVIGSREEMVIFFEVPDMTRILQELAFWDIYHEHCSYFCPASLGRLFRLNGFSVAGIRTVYDDQYLIVTARPATASEVLPVGGADVTEVKQLVDQFVAGLRVKIEAWRSRLNQLRAAGRRVAIWGSGSKCVSFLATVGCSDAIDCIVDINPHRHGKFLPVSGKEIVSPDALPRMRPDVVVVMNAVYRAEIQESVIKLGVDAHVEAV